MELHFLNYHHKGDIHYSKEFMKDLYNIINPSKCYLHHVNSPRLINDLPFIQSANPILRKHTTIPPDPTLINKNGVSVNGFIKFNGMENPYNYLYQNAIEGDHVYIVTWLSFYWFGSNPTSSDKGCSLYSNYEAYKTVYDELGISEYLLPLEYYIPQINFSHVEKACIDKFCSDHPNKKVFLSNGDVLSGQSYNFDFTPSLARLADEFPNITFIVSHKTPINRPNIHYTNDIININECDLNEIGYLSTYCNICIGRGSGPFCFSHIKENFDDTKKTMISFAYGKYDAFWYLPEGGCKQVWSNQFDDETVYNTIKREIILL